MARHCTAEGSKSRPGIVVRFFDEQHLAWSTFYPQGYYQSISDDMKNWIELGVLTTNEDAANG